MLTLKAVNKAALKNAPALKAAGASLTGAVLSATGVVTAAFAVFMQPISEQYGWGRAKLALAITMARWFSALSSPVVGYSLDRWGVRAVVIPLTFLSGCAVLALRFANGSLLQFYVLFAALGLLSPGIAPYSKVLSGWFNKRRGLALGSFGVGVFICAAVIPQLASWLLGVTGWKNAFVVLGAIVIVISLPILFFYLKERKDVAHKTIAPALEEGEKPLRALRSKNYWFITAGLGMSLFTFIGLEVHGVSIFRDKGLSIQAATTMASLIAVGGLAAQVVTGHLLDRYNTPQIIVPFAIAAFAGLLTIQLSHNTTVLVAGCVLLGLGSGGETSMTSYYVTRFFGLKHFSQIYTSIGLINTFTVGFSPVLIGGLYDWQHSYQWGLITMEAALLLAVVFYALLGPYRFQAKKAA